MERGEGRKPRMYPDHGLSRPKGEFRNIVFEMVRERFRRSIPM